MKCRLCEGTTFETLIDLGLSPLSNRYITGENLESQEVYFPLHTRVCNQCFLAQIPEYEKPALIFQDYAYFSSYSSSWIRHCESYCRHVISEFNLNKDSLIVEVASNDGYLLKNFIQRGISCLGIEPASNVAEVAISKGVDTKIDFFGSKCAIDIQDELGSADLIVSKNVLAHVPDIHDFVEGYRLLLKKDGVITVEFPHLLELVRNNQFDTIYHEHFSYLSLRVVQQLFDLHSLRIFDVQKVSTHGGSLRIYGTHKGSTQHPLRDQVKSVIQEEWEEGLFFQKTYQNFQLRVVEIKSKLVTLLSQIRLEQKRAVGYGAAAKGNTLLNYCGIRSDLLEFVADKSEKKQGLYLPGTRLPICSPEQLFENPPDYVLILPWNLKDEILQELSELRQLGTKFITPIPEIEVC